MTKANVVLNDMMLDLVSGGCERFPINDPFISHVPTDNDPVPNIILPVGIPVILPPIKMKW